jgi:hypothetical protein
MSLREDVAIRGAQNGTANLTVEVTQIHFVVDMICDDRIPDERRSRRRTRTTKFERILVMRKE